MTNVECPTCGDSGVIEVALPPNPDMRLIDCPDCTPENVEWRCDCGGPGCDTPQENVDSPTHPSQPCDTP